MGEQFPPLNAEQNAGPAPADVRAQADGISCSTGRDQLRAQAEQNGNAELLARYDADYPKGPHDRPQSMCPA
ncbi:MAG: chlorophyllide reductase subunit Y, partial [Beijerinckiaceae bacterium]|nr:chlorophyllide reductase subunit Y [Beijerinckiaceae bacterium]